MHEVVVDETVVVGVLAKEGERSIVDVTGHVGLLSLGSEALGLGLLSGRDVDVDLLKLGGGGVLSLGTLSDEVLLL